MKGSDAVSSVERLPRRLVFYLDAWFDLDTCREVGMGLGPIPWTAIIDYAREYELQKWHKDIFVSHIKKMDAAYRARKAEEAEKERQRAEAARAVSVKNRRR